MNEHAPVETRKIKIPEKKLGDLINIRTRLDAEIKKLEASQVPLKKQRSKAESLISTYVNKHNGTQNFTSKGVQCYASASDHYNLIPKVGRDMLNAWILDPSKAEVSQAVYDEMLRRLKIFKNEVVKDFCEEHRLDTGGIKVSTGKSTFTIEDGDLPDGINMHRDDRPNFRKAAK